MLRTVVGSKQEYAPCRILSLQQILCLMSGEFNGRTRLSRN